jgi:malonyl-CoA decarboxylase
MRQPLVLADLLARVAEVGRSLAFTGPAAGAPEAALLDLCAEMLRGRGEATGMARASEALARYAILTPPQRAAFFSGALARFGVDPQAVDRAVARWRESGADADARALHSAAEPRSQELIRRLNRAPGGPKALVAMRADLLAAMRDDPALAALDQDFQHLFASWFNRGFIELQSIDWNSPAAILEKIIAYEAVHEINGWDDLRRRVAAPDRRLYAFFHPALADDPLIFVEVALTAAVPAAIAPILAAERDALDPAEATTAVFYSISNCQTGLRGVSFGNFLIKQVVETLRAELPNLATFVTLSPVPGLRPWAEAEAAKDDGALSADERPLVEALRAADWGEIAQRAEPLAALAARYLVEAKSPRGGPVDPVARFHLGNGARLDRVNPCADASPRGQRGSWGVMVNYLYDLDRIERNHEAFAAEGVVAASTAVKRLAKPR